MKTIALSGVNRGIGEAVGRAFLGAGWFVVGIGRSPPPWMAAEHERLSFHPCDMADHEAVQIACADIHRPIDVLICNAASFGPLAFHTGEFDPADFVATLSVNVVAPMVLAKSLRPQMLAAKRKLIIMMSTGNASLSGNTAGSMLAYRASKSALNQVVRNIAADWGTEGFVATALNPGWVRTDMGGEQAPLTPDEAAAEILSFVENVATPALNGAFVNTDGSPLPW